MALSRDEFVALLTSSQRRLCGFICTLVVDLTDAEEVLQETNLTLWQQADRFEPGTDFVAWACRVAHFKVLKWRDARKRQRAHFDDEVLDVIASEAIEEQRMHGQLAAERYELRRLALAACLDELSDRNRTALMLRYNGKHSLTSIGAELGRTANAVSQLLHRIRSALRECMDRRLAETAP
jgi:RNA polymerase sigma-70 factor (ECF subfamily)